MPFLEDLYLKHYEGMHDQSTHGDRMGGSGGGGASATRNVVDRLTAFESTATFRYLTTERDSISGVPRVGRQTRLGDELMSMYAEETGMSRAPAVFSDASFSRLVEDGTFEQVFRGVSRAERGTQFIEGEWHTGRGVFGTGTYVGYGEKAASVAESYARTSLGPGRVLRIGLASDVHLTTYADLYREQADAISHLNHELTVAQAAGDRVGQMRARQKFAFISDIGRFAALMGYDGYRIEDGSGYMVLINRSKLAVSSRLFRAGEMDQFIHRSFDVPLAKHYEGMHDQSTHGDRMSGGGGGGERPKNTGLRLADAQYAYREALERSTRADTEWRVHKLTVDLLVSGRSEVRGKTQADLPALQDELESLKGTRNQAAGAFRKASQELIEARADHIRFGTPSDDRWYHDVQLMDEQRDPIGYRDELDVKHLPNPEYQAFTEAMTMLTSGQPDVEGRLQAEIREVYTFGRGTPRAHALLKAMQHAPRIRTTLYRTVNTTMTDAEIRGKFKPRHDFDVSLSMFSTTDTSAIDISRGGPSSPTQTVVFELHSGRALEVGGFDENGNVEFLTGGKFITTGIRVDEDGVYHIQIRQKAMLRGTEPKLKSSYPEFTRHYEGMHDQSTHGNRMGGGGGGPELRYHGGGPRITDEEFTTARLRVQFRRFQDGGRNANESGFFEHNGKEYFYKEVKPGHAARELAAIEIAHEVGVGDRIVHETVVHRGGKTFVVAERVDLLPLGQIDAFHQGQLVKRTTFEELARMTMFEYLINDVDTHNGNVFSLNGRLVRGDFNLAFHPGGFEVGRTGEYSPGSRRVADHDSVFLAELSMRSNLFNPHRISSDLLDRVIGSRATLLEAARQNGLAQDEIDGLAARIDHLESLRQRYGDKLTWNIFLRETGRVGTAHLEPAGQRGQDWYARHYEGMHDQSTHGDRMSGGGGGDPIRTKYARPRFVDDMVERFRAAKTRSEVRHAADALDARWGRSERYNRLVRAAVDYADDPVTARSYRRQAETWLRGGAEPESHVKDLIVMSELAPESDAELFKLATLSLTPDQVLARFQPGAKMGMVLQTFNEAKPTERALRRGANRQGHVVAEMTIERGARALPVFGHSADPMARKWLMTGQFQVSEIQGSGTQRDPFRIRFRQVGDPRAGAVEYGRDAHFLEARADAAMQRRDSELTQRIEDMSARPFAEIATEGGRTYDDNIRYRDAIVESMRGNSRFSRFLRMSRQAPYSRTLEALKRRDFDNMLQDSLQDAPRADRVLYGAEYRLGESPAEFVALHPVGSTIDVRTFELTHRANPNVKSRLSSLRKEAKAAAASGQIPKQTRGHNTAIVFEVEEGAQAIRVQTFATSAEQWDQAMWLSSGHFEVTSIEETTLPHAKDHVVRVRLRQTGLMRGDEMIATPDITNIPLQPPSWQTSSTPWNIIDRSDYGRSGRAGDRGTVAERGWWHPTPGPFIVQVRPGDFRNVRGFRRVSGW